MATAVLERGKIAEHQKAFQKWLMILHHIGVNPKFYEPQDIIPILANVLTNIEIEGAGRIIGKKWFSPKKDSVK